MSTASNIVLKVSKTERGVGVGGDRKGRSEGGEEGMKERKEERGRKGAQT